MIQIRLTEQEAGAVRSAIALRLAGIRGYNMREEEYLQSVSDRLAKKLNN